MAATTVVSDRPRTMALTMANQDMAATGRSEDHSAGRLPPEPSDNTKPPKKTDNTKPPKLRALRLPRWPVHRWALFTDTLVGRRDGRRGLPVVDREHVAGTPRLEEIHRAGRGHLDRIRGDVIAACQNDYAREIDLAEFILPRAEERLEEAERRLDAARLAGIASGRRLGEDHLPQDLIERRRERESARRISRAMNRVEDARNEVRKAHGELEAVRRNLLARSHESYAKAEEVYHRVSRRSTRYLHAAQRRHPDRAAFAAAYHHFLPAPPTQDEWWDAIKLEMT